MTKEQQIELKKMGLTTNQKVTKMEEQKRLWQSEKIELVHKNKTLQRKVGELRDKEKDHSTMIEELSSDNSKMQIQMDEMRAVFRGKLMEFMKGAGKKGGIGYDLNARQELIRTYTEKEVDVSEKLERSLQKLKKKTVELKSLKNWSRQVKYLAEDWAPIGIPLPDILTRPPPTNLEGFDLDDHGRLQ